jgi:hypothetical protein
MIELKNSLKIYLFTVVFINQIFKLNTKTPTKKSRKTRFIHENDLKKLPLNRPTKNEHFL